MIFLTIKDNMFRSITFRKKFKSTFWTIWAKKTISTYFFNLPFKFGVFYKLWIVEPIKYTSKYINFIPHNGFDISFGKDNY